MKSGGVTGVSGNFSIGRKIFWWGFFVTSCDSSRNWLGGIRFAAFAERKNAKRELSFFLSAARIAGQSPKGSKAADPPVGRRRCLG
jgi:hypothetical protein